MKKILNISWKDIKNRFTSPSELLFYLILPLLFTFLLGGGFSQTAVEEDLPRLAVVDEDHTKTSSELLALLKESQTVKVESFTQEDGEAALVDKEIDAYLIILAGFETRLMAGEQVTLDLRTIEDTQAARAGEQAALTAAETLGRALTAAQISVTEHERLAPFGSAAARTAYFARSLSTARNAYADLPERVRTTVPVAGQEVMGLGEATAAQSSAGQLVTWVFIPLLGTSVVLTYERTNGTLRRLLTTPTSKGTFLLGSYAGQLIPALVQIAILVAFGIFVMDVSWGGSIEGLVILLLAFSLASVAFGTLLGTLMKTDGQANNMSIMSGMAMALLGGCWWPTEFLPQAVQTVAKVFPTAWVMQGLNDLVLRGYGLADVLLETGVLVGFALVFFMIGVWRFRFE